MPPNNRRRGSSAGINHGDAGDQIAMIAGSADASICIRAIHSDRKSQGMHPPQEYAGTLADIGKRTLVPDSEAKAWQEHKAWASK